MYRLHKEMIWCLGGILILGFSLEKKKDTFVLKIVCCPSVSVCLSVMFIVIVPSPKPFDIATSTFAGA